MKSYNDEERTTKINERCKRMDRFPLWSIYAPVVPCVYDGALSILEQISKLYYYANKLNRAIEQNHDDIITLSERVDGCEDAISRIQELIGDIPKFVEVVFDVAAYPFTANKPFSEIQREYRAGSFIVGRTNGDQNLYIALSGSANAVNFISFQSAGAVTIIMRESIIEHSITRFITEGGGTIAGRLNLLNSPSEPHNAVNKQYVDSSIDDAINTIDLSAYLPLAGGTMSGAISQPIAPTENRHLVNKGYVDRLIKEGRTIEVGSEQQIGEWVENGLVYGLYRKIVPFGMLPNNSQKSIPHEIEDVHRFTRVEGIATNILDFSTLPIPLATVGGGSNIYMGVGNARITISTATDRSNYAAYITLEYIKADQRVD